MTSRAHLTAVSTTDKNGRPTTVYRNLQGRAPSAASAAIPAPGPRASGARRTRTPLPPVQHRSAEEISEFMRGTRSPGDDLYTLEDRVGWLWQTDDGLAAVSFAMDLIGNGTLDREVAAILISGGAPDEPSALKLESLRIAERALALGGTPGRAPNMLAFDLRDAVKGVFAGAKDPAGYRVTTEEELESAAAVVRYVLHSGYHHVRTVSDRDTTLSPSTEMPWRRIRNRDVERLIRRRPQDVERIISYVEERGDNLERKQDVQTLIEWLDAGDEGSEALDDGWL